MIVQVSKFIIAKRNIHLKEIEQYLKSLKSNINPELIKISKKLINEGKNIISQNNKKKYAEFQRIAQNITKMRDELEQKMQQELKSDKTKLRAEIEGKIVQNEKEFEEFRKSFLAQFKAEKDAKKVPEMKKQEVIEEFKGKQVTSAIHKSKKSPKEAENNNYLHLLENKTLYMYNIREEKCIKIPITLNGVKKDIPRESKYIELGGNIYLVGGHEHPTTLKNTYISYKKNGEFEEISPMKAPRARHTLVSLYPHYIYAIGGFDREKNTQLSSCEVLDVRSQSWSDAPQLLKPRCDIGGCSFNNAYIYIFGGEYEGNYPVDDIEFLDCSLNTSWTSISTQLQHNLFPEINSVACAQIDSHNIIIYGGYVSGGSQDKSFIFDLNTMKIRELKTKLKNRERFENSNPVIYEDKIYNIGDQKNIHIFDIKSLEFDIIQKNIWKK